MNVQLMFKYPFKSKYEIESYATIHITIGAIVISEMLGKCSLSVLDLSFNDIGDDGITAIAGALSNSHISELNVKRCDIALTGAAALAEGLLVSESVTKINLCMKAWSSMMATHSRELSTILELKY